MKLRKLHIDDYKMFKDFDISFVDANDEALPIVVLAGVNGSGKTTLLYCVYNPKSTFEIETIDKQNNIGMANNYSASFGVSNDFDLDREEIEEDYYKDIVYFKAGIDNLKNVTDEFVKTFYDFLKNKDYRPSEVKEHFDKYMKDIFDGLDLTFNYSHLDRDDNVWFTNDNAEAFEIKSLSTGEKTLLSKIMYLYFLGYKDKVILIDEPELSLHPSWQNKVLKIYENFALKNNCQIIIATHSPHIIGSAKPEYIRVLKKVEDKIEVMQYTQSYGLEFSQILTDIMGVDYLRTPEVAEKLESIKTMIVEEKYDSEEFQSVWNGLEEMLGKNYLDLKLLKLEIASRRKNASNN